MGTGKIISLYQKKQNFIEGLSTATLRESINAEITILMEKKIDGMVKAFEDAKFDDIYVEIEQINVKIANTNKQDWGEMIATLVLSSLGGALIKIAAVSLSKTLSKVFVRLNHKINNHAKKEKIVAKILELDTKYTLLSTDDSWETIFQMHVSKNNLDSIDRILRDELSDLKSKPLVDKFLEEMGKGLLKEAQDKNTPPIVSKIPIPNNLTDKSKILDELQKTARALLEDEKKKTHTLVSHMEHKALIKTYPPYRKRMHDQANFFQKSREAYVERIKEFKRSVMFTGLVINTSTWTSHFIHSQKVMLPNSGGLTSDYVVFKKSIATEYLQIPQKGLKAAMNELLNYLQRHVVREHRKYFGAGANTTPPSAGSVIAECKFELVAFTLPGEVAILIQAALRMTKSNKVTSYYFYLHPVASSVEEEALKKSKPKSGLVTIVGKISPQGSSTPISSYH